MSDPSLDQVLGSQRDDGSWGAQADPPRRVVTTIFAARSLQEGGHADHPAVGRALDFLTRTAIVEGGGSIGGTRDTVYPCYDGMLARLLVRAGRLAEARPLLTWLVRYQPVASGGVAYHVPADPAWGSYLQHRYGGCMASTTCLLGLVPASSALAAARAAGLDLGQGPLLDAMRQLLVDRRVLFARSGAILPLARRTRLDPHGTRWLAPAFPLDYTIDLLELVQLAVDLQVPLEPLSEALALIRSWRLPQGGWPMLAARRLPQAYRPEQINRRRPSRLITARVKALGLDAVLAS